jgi:hypothetical protein
VADAAANGQSIDNATQTLQARYLRQMAVEYIKRNRAAYYDDWITMVVAETGKKRSHRRYVKYMAEPTTYATHLEIAVLSFLLKRRICIISHRPNGSLTGLALDPIEPFNTQPRRGRLYLHLRNPGSEYAHYDAYVRSSNRRSRSSNNTSNTSSSSVIASTLSNNNFVYAPPRNQLELLHNLLLQPGVTLIPQNKAMLRQRIRSIANGSTARKSPSRSPSRPGSRQASPGGSTQQSGILNGANDASPVNQIDMLRNILASPGLSNANRQEVQRRIARAYNAMARRATQERHAIVANLLQLPHK